MEFDEHEEQEGEIGMNNNSGAARKISGGGGGTTVSAGGTPPAIIAPPTITYRYRECLKNHAVGIGGNAVDGCGEFMAAGGDGTLESLICAACGCHRNFHRKEAEGGGGEAFHHHHHQHQQPPYPPPQHHHLATAYSFRSPHPAGYLHVTPQQQPARPLALPANSREEEDMSNPSSSGGDGSKKRFRTRFTPEQKEKMLGFAERLGWRIQKQDEALVQQFCAETNVRRHVLKVWMHNNKHTLGKKP